MYLPGIHKLLYWILGKCLYTNTISGTARSPRKSNIDNWSKYYPQWCVTPTNARRYVWPAWM